MKTILKTLLIAVAAFLIQTSTANAQYTYQTAQRYVFWSSFISTDSNVVLQPGIATGCATVTTQAAWMLLGFCSSGNLNMEFGGYKSGTDPADMSVVIYGPFTDTLNLGSKLINANIDTCVNGYIFSTGQGPDIYNFNYNKGDIYLILIMSTTNIYTVSLTTLPPSSNLSETDTAYCRLCNSQLSQLFQPICTVTFDSASQKNKIVWPKDIFTPAEDYVMFRKNTAGTFDTLGFQSISQLSEYVDATSSPMAKLYEYKLGIRDSCGQFIDKAPGYPYYSFTTMHLIAYPTGNNSSGLIWNPGSFQGPFLIYRTDPSGTTTLIDSIGLVTGTQTYTDINAPAGLCSYQIGVNINPPCVASVMPGYTIVKSNPGYVTVTGINELADLSKAISIEPNPFNQFTKVDLHLFTKQNLKVVLIDLTGQVVMQHDNVKTDELIIERKNLSQGLYFLEVTGDGFYARKKLVVE